MNVLLCLSGEIFPVYLRAGRFQVFASKHLQGPRYFILFIYILIIVLTLLRFLHLF